MAQGQHDENRPTALRGLCRAIRADLESDPRGRDVAALLGHYASEGDDWRRYALFDPDRYARNLIRICDAYELMVICWQPGHASPIHNHASQHCWMAVLEGVIEETYYETPAPGRVGGLVRTSARAYRRGEVSYIHDDLALHAIRPTGDAPAISLHCYARPIEACSVYCPDTGRVESRRLAYDSVDGVPTDRSE